MRVRWRIHNPNDLALIVSKVPLQSTHTKPMKSQRMIFIRSIELGKDWGEWLILESFPFDNLLFKSTHEPSPQFFILIPIQPHPVPNLQSAIQARHHQTRDRTGKKASSEVHISPPLSTSLTRSSTSNKIKPTILTISRKWTHRPTQKSRLWHRGQGLVGVNVHPIFHIYAGKLTCQVVWRMNEWVQFFFALQSYGTRLLLLLLVEGN